MALQGQNVIRRNTITDIKTEKANIIGIGGNFEDKKNKINPTTTAPTPIGIAAIIPTNGALAIVLRRIDPSKANAKSLFFFLIVSL